MFSININLFFKRFFLIALISLIFLPQVNAFKFNEFLVKINPFIKKKHGIFQSVWKNYGGLAVAVAFPALMFALAGYFEYRKSSSGVNQNNGGAGQPGKVTAGGADFKAPNLQDPVRVQKAGFFKSIENSFKLKGKNIFRAAQAGDIQTLKMFIENGADVNQISNYGDNFRPSFTTEDYNLGSFSICTLLGVAIIENQPRVVEFLLNNGASAIKEFGLYPKFSPIFLAILLKRKEIVKMLIKSGVSSNFKIDEILCPSYFYMDICLEGFDDHLLRGKNYDLLNICCALKGNSQEILEIVKILVEEGHVKINSDNAHLDYSTIYTALERPDAILFRYLIAHGANIELKFNNGETILEYACRKNKIDMVKVLVEEAKVNVNEKGNNYPIHIACTEFKLNEELLEYLLSKGADPFLKDSDGKMVIEYVGRKIFEGQFVANNYDDEARRIFNLLLAKMREQRPEYFRQAEEEERRRQEQEEQERWWRNFRRGSKNNYELEANPLVKEAKKDLKKNAYETLGVEHNADDVAIRKTYKRLILRWHPDQNPDNKEQAEEMLMQIKLAHDVLIDKEARRIYDANL